MAVSKGAAPKGGKSGAHGKSASGEAGHGGHKRGKQPKDGKAKKMEHDPMAKGKAKAKKTMGKTPSKSKK
jgi:hypothetical protein